MDPDKKLVFRLCYVDGCWAWFTTREPFTDQWGDDWGDAPFDSNAGDPYAWSEHDGQRGVAPYSICTVAWKGPFDDPGAWIAKSPYSVEAINSEAVPWLAPSRFLAQHAIQIYAGVTLDEFCASIKSAGGGVWVPAW